MDTTDIEDFGEKVNSREDFEKLVQKLVEEFRESGDQWENAQLSEFLAAIERFVSDLDGFYLNRGESIDLENPTWRVFAHILLGARVYE
jgi:hypothetical protein